MFIGGMALLVTIVLAILGVKNENEEENKPSKIRKVLFRLRTFLMKIVLRIYYFSYLPLTISLFINLYLVISYLNLLASIK